MQISILASGRGPKSLSDWLKGSVFLHELLQLDVLYVPKQSSLNFVSESCVVRYLLRSNLSPLLRLALLPTSSGWRLTLWSVQKADKESWGMSGWVGGADGVDLVTPSTTKLGPICS